MLTLIMYDCADKYCKQKISYVVSCKPDISSHYCKSLRTLYLFRYSISLSILVRKLNRQNKLVRICEYLVSSLPSL